MMKFAINSKTIRNNSPKNHLKSANNSLETLKKICLINAYKRKATFSSERFQSIVVKKQRVYLTLTCNT